MMNIIGALLGLLPGFAWLAFYLQEDLHPEPKRLIGLTFLVGAAAAFLALGLELAMNNALATLGIGYLTAGSLFMLALIEETVKFGAAYLVIHKNKAFDEPVDAMIYMVVAALGFATVENIGALVNGGANQLALVATIFAATSLRFVGATLLHTLTSGTVGYAWARGIRDMNVGPHLVVGLAIASALHAVFNYFIINHGNIIYTAVFLLIVGFFVLNDFEELRRKKL